MAKFTVEFKRDPGKEISGYDFGYSAPEIFRDWINDEWQEGRPGAIVECVPHRHTHEMWEELGAYLVRQLNAEYRFVGLFLDCGQQFPPLLHWLGSAAREIGDEVPDEWAKQEVCGFFVQSTYHAQWMQSMWKDTDSNWFDFAIGLMLAWYDTRESLQMRFDDADCSAALADFGKSLRRAAAWLVPWDANIGFQVGLPVGSQLYKRLTYESPR